MTNNAELMYDTRPPPPNRLITIVSDGSTGKVEFVGKLICFFTVILNTQQPSIM